MHVDSSRAICIAVAKGEVDIAIIGGEVPEELRDLVQVSTGVSVECFDACGKAPGACMVLRCRFCSCCRAHQQGTAQLCCPEWHAKCGSTLC